VEKLLASLGPVCALIGAQWGDEGKGKVTDLLAEHYDVIARACGGANAGHTIVVAGQKRVFHLIPSGCLHEGKQIILGSGMVIHLPTLLEEIRVLRDAGIDVIPRMRISGAAHLVLDYHRDIDAALEEQRSASRGGNIGTTRRGIGPAYMEKAARSGMRIEQLRSGAQLLRDDLQEHKKRVEGMFGVVVDIEKELANLREAAALLSDRIAPMEVILDLLNEGKTILVEGAQGTLLDIDHGTYPYVTSSSTTAAGLLQGVGLPPRALTSCIGVAKAYCTRVGSGPFPAEAPEEAAARLRERGGEYGATTGRPRRCGWLHLPDLRFAARLSGVTCWNLTKLDVLDEEERIPVGTGVKGDGSVVFEELPGWRRKTSGITSFGDLPQEAQSYVRFIEEKTGITIGLIGTGQGREEMIVKS
jgi:adenylosuccinate synthase